VHAQGPGRYAARSAEPTRIVRADYCSIDTEGAEYNIIREFDFEALPISVLTIENNYDDPCIPDLMKQKGYEFVAKLGQDYVFKKADVRQLPRTTVICAVWSGDPVVTSSCAAISKI
jgi:hypothetical protein